MKLVVGLGNPGSEYENTRHNVGFMVIDSYCKGEKFSKKMDGLYLEKTINGNKVIFIKPQTYMNLSGNCVVKFKNYYKLDSKDIMIIRDDLDLNVGNYKIKFNSSSGGNNGIKSIINSLGTQEFMQFKIGISNNKSIEKKDYVLGKFSKSELNEINKIIDFSNTIIDSFILNDNQYTISKYNNGELNHENN